MAEIELDIKCTKCGHQCSVDQDPEVPLACNRCNGPVVIEDWTILEEED